MTTDLAGQWVGFLVGGEEYAFPVLATKEIVRFDEPPRRIPNMPYFLAGILDLRGHVIPVVDLARRFGAQAKERTPAARIIVAAAAGRTVGFATEGVTEIFRIDSGEVREVPEGLAGRGREFLAGVARTPRGLALLCDADRILTLEETEVLAK